MHARENADPKAAPDHHDPGPSGEGRFASGPVRDVDLVLRTGVFDADDLRRAVTRIAHEIVERNHGADDVVLVGLYTRGVALARRLAASISSFESVTVPVGALDATFYRDDIGLRAVAPIGPTEVPDVSGRVAVLVDDVLFTGRTVRADFVGKNLPTGALEDVRVRLAEVDGGDDVVELWGPPVVTQ